MRDKISPSRPPAKCSSDSNIAGPFHGGEDLKIPIQPTAAAACFFFGFVELLAGLRGLQSLVHPPALMDK